MVRAEACDWAARLDDRGYHQVPISRPDTTWRWDGPTETAEDGFIDGHAIVLSNGDTEFKVKVGDVAYLTGISKGKPAEVVQIIDICEKPGKETAWLGVKFFWRPERMKLSDDIEWHQRELFLQTERHKKEMWCGTVELVPLTIIELHDVSKLPEPPPPHTFFYRREYDGKQLLDLEPPNDAGVDAGSSATADTGAGAQPMDAETTAPPPPEQPERPKRRNKNDERLAALEAQVASLQLKADVTDALVTELADLKVAVECAQAQLEDVGSLKQRVAKLEAGL